MTRGESVASASADALAGPDGAGPQHAPQFAGAGQVGPIPGPQGEVLSLTRQEPFQTAVDLAPAGRRNRARIGEPVVRVWPDGGLHRIGARGRNPLRERQQLVTAPLADGREGHRVPGEIESDLVRLPGAVAATDRDDRQDRPIYAA